MLNEHRLKTNILYSNSREESEDTESKWSFWLFCTSLWKPCCGQLECSLMVALLLRDACAYPVTQDPRGSFENGTVLRSRDNFNKCSRSDCSKFQIARVNTVMWSYIGFVCMFYLILNVLYSSNLLAVCRFVTRRRIDFCCRRPEELDSKLVESY